MDICCTENALTIPPFVGATNKEKLYNQSGDLYFNGKQLSTNWYGFVPSDIIPIFNRAIEHVLDITTPYICGVITRQVAFAWNFPVELDEINVRTNYIMRIFDCYLKSVRDCVRTFEQGSSCDDACDAKDAVARLKHSSLWQK